MFVSTDRILYLIRARIREPLVSEASDSNAYSSNYTELSDANIIERINAVYRELYEYVKVQHIPDITDTAPLDTDLPDDYLRLLTESVTVNDVPAVYRTPKAVFLLEEGRTITDDAPVFSIVGNEILLRPEGDPFDYEYVASINAGIVHTMVPLIVLRVLNYVYRTLNLHEIADYYFKLYQSHLLYFQIGNKFSTFPDKEVEVEYD